MSIKTGVITGAVVGAGTAIILISLDNVRPFSPDANAFVERLTFKLCPLHTSASPTSWQATQEWRS